MDLPIIHETKDVKVFKAPGYAYFFNKKTGTFVRVGADLSTDPVWSRYGPEILDIEISSGGDCVGECPYCYKCNGGDQPTKNMSLDTFKAILDKMPRTLCQAALGIMNMRTNPDFFEMMEYSKSCGVIPNYTTHGLDVTDEDAQRTAELCGAVSVSIIRKESWEAVAKFTQAQVKQVNIHHMLSCETYDKAFKVVDRAATMDVRAVVFLQYKPKGRNPDAFHNIADIGLYEALIGHCKDAGIGFGFDSCSAPMYFKCLNDKQSTIFAEPCESGLFSSYINVDGHFFPCSFAEGEGVWVDGIDVLSEETFLKGVWENARLESWRRTLLESTSNCNCMFRDVCRACPIYSITPCKEGNNENS